MPKDWSITGGSAWDSPQRITPDSYRCGYCGNDVASDQGWQSTGRDSYVRICPQCNVPTFFSVPSKGLQIPGPKQGSTLTKLPADIRGIYEEARASLTVNAYTATVLLCRKLLMHIGVEKGAKEGQTFLSYVEWLIQEGHAPKSANRWIDYIRERSNEANHRIMLMKQEDAVGILGLTEQLLRVIYELPTLVPTIPAPPTSP